MMEAAAARRRLLLLPPAPPGRSGGSASVAELLAALGPGCVVDADAAGPLLLALSAEDRQQLCERVLQPGSAFPEAVQRVVREHCRPPASAPAAPCLVHDGISDPACDELLYDEGALSSFTRDMVLLLDAACMRLLLTRVNRPEGDAETHGAFLHPLFLLAAETEREPTAVSARVLVRFFLLPVAEHEAVLRELGSLAGRCAGLQPRAALVLTLYFFFSEHVKPWDATWDAILALFWHVWRDVAGDADSSARVAVYLMTHALHAVPALARLLPASLARPLPRLAALHPALVPHNNRLAGL